MNRMLKKMILRFSYFFLPRSKKLVKQISVGGFDMLVKANEDVGRQLTFLGEYEIAESKFLTQQIRRDDICFDIGANTGYFSFLMARIADRGQIYSFEPANSAYTLLQAGISLNDFNNIDASPLGVANKSGTSKFSLSIDTAFSSLIAVGRRDEDRELVIETIAIDDFIAAKGIVKVDVIKVDVEGAEQLVLEGAKRLLSDINRRPRLIMMELFGENLEPYGTNIDSIISFMGNFSYKPYYLAPTGNLALYKERHYNKFVNVFFKPE